MSRITVFVYAPDPISQAGVAAQLRARPEIDVVDEQPDRAQVAVVSVDRIDEDAMRVSRAVQRNGRPRLVLVVGSVEEQDLLNAVELGVSGLIRRSQASPEQLVETIQAAARGEASLPPDLLERLLKQMKHVHDHVLAPANLHASGLTTREIEVLGLIAEGNDTKEIADELRYSERTIKNIVQDITRRFGLRNRSHAVAYALRHGLI
jgi:DNA-binding NarL/FixJ family response regulator